jgi:putative ABC transport system permease protein
VSLASNLVRDTRSSLRVLRKTPAFTIGAIATVALTVGATTAIFSVVYGVLLRQLPYRNPERVFWIWSDQPGRDRTPFNVPDFIDYRDATRTLSGFAGFFSYSANLSDEAAAERVQGIRATGNFFEVVGAVARIGRLLQPADERPGADQVVVLTEPFWIRRFGGDASVVGRVVRLNGEACTVVGVLAPGFVLPIGDVEFVLPFAADRDPRRGARNSVNFIIGAGRLGDQGHTAAGSGRTGRNRSPLAAVVPGRERQKTRRPPGRRDRWHRRVVSNRAPHSLRRGRRGPAHRLRKPRNLMLTRATSRRKISPVRLALGASRLNVARQVLVETSIVGFSGGVLGMLVAGWGVAALVALAPAALPRSGEIRVDVAVLMFSLVVSFFTSVLFGVIPALASARVDVRDALQGSSRGVTGGGRLVRGLLVSSEVALAVVLLIVVTMLAKSFANVQASRPGSIRHACCRRVSRCRPGDSTTATRSSCFNERSPSDCHRCPR